MVVVSSDMKESIESIKEIVGNGYYDNDIHNALTESNMNRDEAVEKLFRQGAFHEVKKRRDKKKENAESSGQVEIRKPNDYVNRRPKFHPDHNARRGGGPGGYTRRAAPDNLNHRVSREFRVVRDNRVNQSSARETASSTQVVEKSSHVASTNQRRPGGQYCQNLNGRPDVRPKVTEEFSNIRKENLETNTPATGSGSQASVTKHKELPLKPGSSASSSAVGVYASASDPVHVPSPDSRSPAVGAIRREVGVVGGRRQSSESGLKQSSQQNVSNSNLAPRSFADTQSVKQHTGSVSRKDQNHGTAVDSATINSAGNRSANHSTRFHQQPAGPKGALPTKEWKPKTNQKPSVSTPDVIGSSVKSTSQQTDTSKNVESETHELQDKLTQTNIHDTQKVIIAHNIRVSEFERCKLTFGSIGMESDAFEVPTPAFQEADVVEADAVPPAEASPRSSQIDAFDSQVINSAPDSPSGESSENPSPDQNESAVAPNTESFVDRSYVQNSPSFTASQSEQLQESIEMPNFSVYDPQPAYDMPYFRPTVDDTLRGTGMPPNQEALSSHSGNMVPNSSVPMIQQQQIPMAQMYPPAHLSHYANVMPYRQFMPPPMYVPPPMVPGYSGNPGYPQLSNGNSYVLMPGGGSHVPSNGLKYGIQQFKPFPVSSPTGFSNLVSPTGYPMNAPGVVGGPTGLDDSSRLKYKDTNLYVPNPQGETSEVWIQNHREHPGMPSAPYFNMQGQAAHPAYMQTLTGHPGFNGAAPQSSQMQFPGMYLPPPAGIPNGGHHIGNGNIGVGVAAPAAGPQVVGAYQQPQMNHLNWPANF